MLVLNPAVSETLELSTRELTGFCFKESAFGLPERLMKPVLEKLPENKKNKDEINAMQAIE